MIALPNQHEPRKGARAANRLIDYALVAGSLWYVIVYLWIALHRLPYSFDIEWMEGGAVDHVTRVLAGRSIYVPPTLRFIPFAYPPFYYYVCAAVSLVTGIGLFPLRLVSFLSSLGVLAVTYALIRRETASPVAAWVSVGVFAATYRAGGAWLDLARVDSLFVLLTMIAIYEVRFGSSTRSWIAAGTLFALAGLTKQTAIIIAVPMIAWAIWEDWRRAIGMATAFVGVLGTATWLLNIGSAGWYLRYVLYMPAHIQALDDVPPAIWDRHIFGPLPLAVAMTFGVILSGVFRRERWTVFYGLLIAACVGAAWSSGRHSGAYDNVFIPAHLAWCIGLGLAFSELMSASVPHAATHPYAAILCGLQLWMLSYPVSDQIPTREDAELARQLQHLIAATPGTVFMPHHGFVAGAAGKPMTVHAWPLFDLLRAADPETRARITTELHNALSGHQFSLIVLDKMEPWLEDDLNRSLRPKRRPIERGRPVDARRLSDEAPLDLHSPPAVVMFGWGGKKYSRIYWASAALCPCTRTSLSHTLNRDPLSSAASDGHSTDRAARKTSVPCVALLSQSSLSASLLTWRSDRV